MMPFVFISMNPVKYYAKYLNSGIYGRMIL